MRRTSRRAWSRCGLSVAVLFAVASCGGDPDPTDGTGTIDGTDTDETSNTARANATVVEVVDGDTIEVRIDGDLERVRLIGIDTPETKHPTKPIGCYGPEASGFTTALLPVGTDIRVERDLVGRDDYGRLLGYVHVVDTGVFVNREIVRRGFAVPLTIEPNSTYAGAFADDARTAERENVGIWAKCRG